MHDRGHMNFEWSHWLATSKLLHSSHAFPHQRKVRTEGLLGQHALTCHNMYCGERTLHAATYINSHPYPCSCCDLSSAWWWREDQPPGSLYHLHILSLLDLHMAAPLLCLWLLSKQIYSLDRLKYNYYCYSETFMMIINFVSIHDIVCDHSNKVMCV